MRQNISITVGGSRRGMEDARLDPLDTVRALVDWPLPRADAEDAILPVVVSALSRALARCGEVAFRYDGPLPDAELCIPPPPRSLPGRLLDALSLSRSGFGLAIASRPPAVAALFDYGGWSYALQLALVCAPGSDRAPILAALRGSLDWRGRPLPDGVRLLFGPGDDGAFAVIAAAGPEWIDRFREALAS